jgi:tight adherence protein C
VTLLFVIGILLFACAAAMVVRAMTLARVRVGSQIRQIESYGFNTIEQMQRPATAMTRTAQRLSEFAARLGQQAHGTGWRAAVSSAQLRGAGLYKISPDEFQGYRVMLTGGLPALILLDAVATGSFTIVTVLLCGLAAALTWFGPDMLVRTRAQRRMDRVDRDIPELIDLLTATIEAGLGFAGSLALVADRFTGPLGQELRLTLREQAMGLSTDRALANLLARCETPSVRSFVRAISQGEALGVSIGAMMRSLAAETRTRRRQRAHEQIQKAPVKMLFPLVLMVFPSLLIVLLYPAVHQALLQLGG